MKKLNGLIFSTFVIVGATFLPQKASAQGFGIFVSDKMAELNGVKSIANELEYIQNAVTNTLAPAAYLWDQTQQTLYSLQSLDAQVNYYLRYGGLQGYLQNLESSGYYAGSPCYNAKFDCDIGSIWKGRQDASELKTKVTRSAITKLNKGEDLQKTDAVRIKSLQELCTRSVGRMQAQQCTNMLLSRLIDQQMKQQAVNDGLLNQALSDSADKNDKEAREEAATQNALANINNLEKPSSGSFFKEIH